MAHNDRSGTTMTKARIFKRPKSAMSSGKALTGDWVFEYEPREKRRPDPLTGWAGSGDTQAQVQLRFPSEAAAVAYAERHGIAYDLSPTPEKKLTLQAYADNFR